MSIDLPDAAIYLPIGAGEEMVLIHLEGAEDVMVALIALAAGLADWAGVPPKLVFPMASPSVDVDGNGEWVCQSTGAMLLVDDRIHPENVEDLAAWVLKASLAQPRID